MLRDYKFNWRLTANRYCPGYSDFNGYHPCKDNNILYKETYGLCFQCDQAQGFRSTFFFGGEPNEYMREYLAKKHYIYLSFFAPNILKVGTAADLRKEIRPIEQDALIYAYIAESDGFSIQDIEHDISDKLRISEAVSSSAKFKNLSLKPSTRVAKEQITSAYNRIKDFYKNDERFFSWIYESLNINVLNEIEELFLSNFKSS